MANKKGYKVVDWQLSSLEELAEYLRKGFSRGTAQMDYYIRTENTAMIEKIKKARLIAKALNLEEKAASLRMEAKE